MLLLAFAVVYIFWGLTYLAMRIGIESFPPLLLPGTRHLFVGLLLYPLLRWKTGIRPTKEHWKTAAITGCLLLFLANGSVCWAEETVPSGIAALLVATVCLWMVLLDWLRSGGHRPSFRVVAGVAIGFAGMFLLVGPSHLGGSGRMNLTGAGILVFASFSWACGSLYSKHGSLPSSPLLGVGMQSLCGGAALWIAAFLTGQTRHFHFSQVSFRSWMAIGYLAIFGSLIGFTAYMYMLKKSTAARAGTYAFVNPVVALFSGWLFAGEPMTPRTWLSAFVILSAVVLVITAPHRDPAHDVETLPAPGEA
ncbi:MAG TPA: EamA family transporter [Candidatus Acidoferrum sp.]|nr:EamA family transporter [Candidatus Acidoferrum sp.]